MHAKVLVADFQEPEVAIRLRRTELDKMRRWKDLHTDSAFAEQLGMDPGQVSRILRGKSRPGLRFLEGCLRIWGIDAFSNLFELVDDDDGNGEAA